MKKYWIMSVLNVKDSHYDSMSKHINDCSNIHWTDVTKQNESHRNVCMYGYGQNNSIMTIMLKNIMSSEIIL